MNRTAGTLLLAAGLLHALVAAAASDVVINEVMYHPPGDHDDLQFVELFNRGAQAVDLSGWKFSSGIQFEFPAKSHLDPGAFAVVVRDARAFRAHYGAAVPVVGTFTGHLSHGGERIALKDAAGQTADSVKYRDREPWPLGADGDSASLERICPSGPSEAPENWASSRLPPMRRAAGTPGRTNDSFSSHPLPVVREVAFDTPNPGEPASVTATIQGASGAVTATLLWSSPLGGEGQTEHTVPMKPVGTDPAAGSFVATIPAQPDGRLVRFRIRAADSAGTVRMHPSENDPRPTLSYFVLSNTNTSRVPFGYMWETGAHEARGNYYGSRPRQPGGVAADDGGDTPSHGNGVFVYVPPKGAPIQVFDHVRLTPRHGGWKVHFLKDRQLNEVATANLIFEGPSRWVLAEALAYDLYERAGVPAPRHDHVRLWVNGRPLGYQLFIEQPNESFLRRHGRNDNGNVYKVLWYEQGVVRQHEKKTNVRSGHEDLVKLVGALERSSGTRQWEVIDKEINVEEFTGYYAVNQCIQNWDGFFNNYFVYHDTRPGGKWEIYPWDEDKTWGDFDGASRNYDWYTMPLTYGMAGDESSWGQRGGRQGFFGGNGWWRPPGVFSGPLLANPEFRKRFLKRLHELCDNVFVPEKFEPVILGMQHRLEPEVRYRAIVLHQDETRSLAEFNHQMDSFRQQLINRRKFILTELDKAK